MIYDKTTTGPDKTPAELLREEELAEIDRMIARAMNFSESDYRAEVFDLLHAGFRDVTAFMFQKSMSGESMRPGGRFGWRFTQDQLEAFAEHYFAMADIIMEGKVFRDDAGLAHLRRLRETRLPRELSLEVSHG